MDDHVFQLVSLVLGTLGTLLVFLFGFWWKVERKQDHKIDSLAERNGKEHHEMHEKIDRQHHAIRDRLDNIWKHISRDSL